MEVSDTKSSGATTPSESFNMTNDTSDGVIRSRAGSSRGSQFGASATRESPSLASSGDLEFAGPVMNLSEQRNADALIPGGVLGLFAGLQVDRSTQQPTSIELQLQSTLNVIPAYTWYAAPSGALLFVNERTADYLGLPKDHPLRFGTDIGGEWDSHIPLLHPDDQEESRRAWVTCLRTGCAKEFSQRVRNAEGAYRWFLSRAEPLRDSDGTLLGWVGVNLDIEDRKQAENKIRGQEM